MLITSKPITNDGAVGPIAAELGRDYSAVRLTHNGQTLTPETRWGDVDPHRPVLHVIFLRSQVRPTAMHGAAAAAAR